MTRRHRLRHYDRSCNGPPACFPKHLMEPGDRLVLVSTRTQSPWSADSRCGVAGGHWKISFRRCSSEASRSGNNLGSLDLSFFSAAPSRHSEARRRETFCGLVRRSCAVLPDSAQHGYPSTAWKMHHFWYNFCGYLGNTQWSVGMRRFVTREEFSLSQWLSVAT